MLLLIFLCCLDIATIQISRLWDKIKDKLAYFFGIFESCLLVSVQRSETVDKFGRALVDITSQKAESLSVWNLVFTAGAASQLKQFCQRHKITSRYSISVCVGGGLQRPMAHYFLCNTWDFVGVLIFPACWRVAESDSCFQYKVLVSLSALTPPDLFTHCGNRSLLQDFLTSVLKGDSFIGEKTHQRPWGGFCSWLRGQNERGWITPRDPARSQLNAAQWGRKLLGWVEAIKH